MIKSNKTLNLLIILILLIGNVFATTDPLDTLNGLLEKIKTYKYGESRENLVKISNLVRENLTTPHIISDFEKVFIKFLYTDANLSSKQFICEELSLFGTNNALPVLSKMLNNEQTFDMALFTLGRIQGEEVDAIVLKKLPKVSDDQKVPLINFLGNREEKKSAHQILKYIDSKNEMVNTAAIRAAGKIGGDAVINILQRKLRMASPVQTDNLLDALLNTAEKCGQEENSAKAVQIFNSVFNSGYSFQFRHAALSGLLAYSDQDPAKLLVDILKSDDPEAQTIAIQFIHKIPEDANIQVIVDAFPRYKQDQQIQILAAFAGRTDVAIVKLLEDALKNESEEVRITALNSLASSGSAHSVLPVANRAAEASEEEQKAARGCMYMLNAAGTDEAIEQGIISSENSVKIELIRSASERLLTSAENAVVNQLSSSDLQVRNESLKALSKIGSPGILPDLIEHLKNTQDDRESQENARTIIILSKKVSADQSPASAVIEQLEALTKNNKLEITYDILGNIGDPAALPILRSGLKSKSAKEITAAIKALSEWPDESPLSDLQNLAEKTKNETHHVLALRGYVQLLGAGGKNSVTNYRSAMEISRSKSERDMVLSGISKVKDPDALKFVTLYFDDPDLKPASQMAAVQIAENLDVAGVRTSLPVVKTILSNTDLPQMKERCETLLKKLEQYEDFITTWEVAGPYQMDDVNLFDFAFAPENGDSQQVDWAAMPAGLDPDKYWYIALDQHLGGNNRVAYLRNRIFSDEEQEVTLEVGSDDGNKVWINGQLVNSVNAARGCMPGEDKAKITLQKGWNQVLMKVINGNGGWGACLRFRNNDGSKVQGIKAEI